MTTPVTEAHSKADLAHQHILHGISTGRFDPGDRLVLAQLAEELEMSVVPVREAIRRLQAENLVAFERNVGATVIGIDPTQYRYTMETLALVEGYCTAASAPKLSAEEIQRAREINAEMKAVVTGEFNPERMTELNHQFHETIFAHHDNPHIYDLVLRGWNRLATLRSSTFAYVPGRAKESVVEHDNILKLIESGADAAVVEDAARHHRLNTLHAYLDYAATTEERSK